jgi:hypothetical protein
MGERSRYLAEFVRAGLAIIGRLREDRNQARSASQYLEEQPWIVRRVAANFDARIDCAQALTH